MSRSARAWWLQVPLGYTALFACLLWPIAGALGTALPVRPNPCDSHFITWVFSWVLHGLVTDPGRLFDANINYPAPGQLSGSEHFLSSQVAFAPLWWLTRNPVLATNLVAFLSYPAAAIAMERLLDALGYRRAVAWVAGLMFALGPLRVPFNVHVVQYLNFYLPLAALVLVRLRDRPDVRRAVPAAVVLAAAASSSYYLALLLATVAVVWTACELLRRAPGRVRFLLLAIAAALAAGVVVALLSRPYFHRQVVQAGPEVEIARGWWSGFRLATPWGLHGYPPRYQWWAAGLGIAALLFRVPGTHRAIVPALLLVPVGTLLMYGFPPGLASLVGGTPLGFIKWPHRFAVVAGFGDALLVASVLQAIGWWAGRWAGGLATAAFAATLVPAALAVGHAKMDEVAALGAHRPVYEAVARITREHGGGPLLELPRMLQTRRRCISTEPASMVASTIHWLPLVGGYSGYHPPHRGLMLRTVSALPAPWALDDLVDMTHVRWLLIRPPSDWASPEQRSVMVKELAKSPAVGRPIDLGVPDWTLFPVVREPLHREWFQAIAEGARPGKTVLGTPLAPIPEDEAVGAVQSVIVAQHVYAGSGFWVTVRVRNDGHATWPAAPMPSRSLILELGVDTDVPEAYRVALLSVWRSHATGDASDAEVRWLRRDLPGGESLTQVVPLTAPTTPGTYELETTLRQIDGARFDHPGNVPLLATVNVVERPAQE